MRIVDDHGGLTRNLFDDLHAAGRRDATGQRGNRLRQRKFLRQQNPGRDNDILHIEAAPQWAFEFGLSEPAGQREPEAIRSGPEQLRRQI